MMAPSGSVSGRITANSSPPKRATTSVSRALLRITAAASTSARLPYMCPYVSFTALKPSRSMNNIDNARFGAHGALGLAPQRQVQIPRVVQPRQVVGDRERFGAFDNQRVLQRQRRRPQRADRPPGRRRISCRLGRPTPPIEPDQRADGLPRDPAAGTRRRQTAGAVPAHARRGSGRGSQTPPRRASPGRRRPGPPCASGSVSPWLARTAICPSTSASRRPSTGTGHQVGAHDTRNSATRRGSSVACVDCSTCASAERGPRGAAGLGARTRGGGRRGSGVRAPGRPRRAGARPATGRVMVSLLPARGRC